MVRSARASCCAVQKLTRLKVERPDIVTKENRHLGGENGDDHHDDERDRRKAGGRARSDLQAWGGLRKSSITSLSERFCFPLSWSIFAALPSPRVPLGLSV
jgi:hypothetical protein